MEKKTTRKPPDVGDVVMSPFFALGWDIKSTKHVWVGEGYGRRSPEKTDPTRADARFVIEEKFFVHPTAGTAECWGLYARRLNPDGTYDPEGEAVAFLMETDYNYPYIDEIEIVGKMRRIVHFEPIE